MLFKGRKAKRWTKKQIKKNLKAKPIDCEQYIHSTDKTALAALKKIPLLETVCGKLLSILNDTQNNIINMSSKVHITQKQLPKIFLMVKSICNKIGIDMPELYLELNRNPNAYVYGYNNYTIVITSGLLECFEDDEIYAILAHECGHIACKHGFYYTIASMALGGGAIGLHELSEVLKDKGISGSLLSGVLSIVDSSLELALYHWHRCSEFSADRVAAICCGSATPVIETMMRLAGGITHVNSQINKDLFISQAEDYQKMISKSKINKTLEFLITKNHTHPLLSVRAYEIQQFTKTKEFKSLL